MPIREKIKAKFSKNKGSAPSSPPNSVPTEAYYTGRKDIEYYKPHEIPKSKYRGKVDPVHQERLDAFSFGDAFGAARRPSAALSGTFSPGGTKSFSRRTSYASNLGALSRRSSLSSDANASFSIPSSSNESTHMKSYPMTKSADDADVVNTDVSKAHIPAIRLDRQATVTQKNPDSNHIEHSRSSDEMPFTPEELTQAMTRATITPQLTARRVSTAVA